MALISIGKTTDFEEGKPRVVEANGRSFAVVKVDGKFYAIDNTCLHRGGPLGEGVMEGHVLECPWHHWKFDVRTGQFVMNPSAKVQTYKVIAENDEVKVDA